MVAEVDAIRVSEKPEVIGSLFEDTFRSFLQSLLPSSISVVPGFIVAEDGTDSSHFDAILVDNSYPFLAAIGPHRYVMAASVVAAIKLTTMLNSTKLKSIFKKSLEIQTISNKLYLPESFEGISFYAICVDSRLTKSHIKKEFTINMPLFFMFVIRENKNSHGFMCWMEGGKNGEAMLVSSTSTLADFIYRHLQDGIYALSRRVRDNTSISNKMNNYIYWGTVTKDPFERA